jgi:plastocyanin
MAAGRDPHQQTTASRSLVPYRDHAARAYATPLLPFEWDLIATIGCSEEEYRWYKQQISALSKERPAEYAHIPDIRNDPFITPLLISLAVGVVTTAASYLLMPKPETPRQGQNRSLASANGRNRFNQTSGLEGAAEIAQFGSTIPIIFGRYTQRESHTTGGMLATPQLVWSRMFSYGSSQGHKGLYVVGESVINPPDINGIFMGTMPMASLSKEQYAFYWASRNGDNRVKARDLIAGTRNAPFAGDPEPHDDIFQCPTLAAMVDTGFCSVYTPSGSTQFGVYDAIKNGTHNKINWQVISAPDGRDQKNRLRAMRRKIAGGAANQLNAGMPGEGAGYSCFMGLMRHNGVEYFLPTRVQVSPGDVVTFQVRDQRYTDDGFTVGSGVTLDDQNSRSIAEREEADDKLQIGEMFMIGRTVWQVVKRPGRVWDIDSGTFDYDLRCIETTGGSVEIGIAGIKAITNQIGYDGATYADSWLGPSWFPLLHVSFATIRNQRVVDATEFGIRSQAWNRANGLCNFPEVPTPADLAEFDSRNISLTTGTRTGFFSRTTVFTIAVRPVGLNTNGQPFAWELIGEQFCITGQTPTDQYNYIRIKSRVQGQFEYRFIPKSGADVRQFSPDNAQFWQLNANATELIGADYTNRYGTFRLTTTGSVVAAIDVRSNDEFRTKGLPGTSGAWITQAARLVVDEWLPSNVTQGKFGGWHTYYLGPATSYQGQVRSVNITLNYSVSQTVTIRLTARSIYQPFNPLSGGWEWENPSTMTIIGWSTQPPNNLTFDAQVFVVNSFYRGLTGPRLRVVHDSVYVPGNPATLERYFELASQIADVSHYQEVEKSNSSNPEHEIVYVNESVTNPERPTYNNMTMFGMAIRSSKSVTTLDQVRVWIPDGIPTLRFETNTIGPANKFSDLVYFLLTDTRSGAGRRIPPELIDTEGFRRSARFLTQNRIYFDGVIENQVNIREYITQLAPLHLCHFVIANGKFTVEPALPTESDGSLRQGAVTITALFTAGNIIENSFAVNYLEADDRQFFRAVMTYRESAKNQLPESRSMMVLWADGTDEFKQAKMETYDLSAFCTYREQAFLAARYLMSMRRRITHTISFKTTPEGLYLAPGQYIRVVTKASPNVAYDNGVVDAAGNVTSLAGALNGTYQIFAYRTGDTDVRLTSMTVVNNQTTDASLFNSLFTVRSEATNCNIYQVDQLTMDEDGLVEVQASDFPCDSQLRSLIVQDVLDESRFEVLD